MRDTAKFVLPSVLISMTTSLAGNGFQIAVAALIFITDMRSI
jgi:hypothetical protein